MGKMRRIILRTKKAFSCNVSTSTELHVPFNVDVREEYANAFRTESYNEFWARVLALSHNDSLSKKSLGSTSTTRLLSYRIFVDHLLDPDQPTVTKLLSLTKNRPKIMSLLTNYFEHTANASFLCGQLLKDTDKLRVKYRSLKKTLESFDFPQFSSSSTNHLPIILTRLTEITKSINPFVNSSSSLARFQAVKSNCSELLKRLESRRDRVKAKLHVLNSFKVSSAVFLVALTTSITIIVITHFVAMSMAVPGLIIAFRGSTSTKQLAKTSAQLDAAAKGTYILNRDLDTISRLVARLDDELEHIRAMVEFWMDRVDDHLHAQAGEEVARQLKRNDAKFMDQLDELEEHLYLCFMTINRARNLVVKEILDLHHPR
ncbi:UPF0496 protein At3g49070-like [Chenopodium quinoa]|uniref:UPF0496 protein At3g49070-like n=1 Tax=Chenopodium quinoa TaxID=63459 RepID=UPI000B76C031|nr:UPF0496 protein At3g49070-like [Chenopodium quinoa]